MADLLLHVFPESRVWNAWNCVPALFRKATV
jgi:hypothetical protein